MRRPRRVLVRKIACDNCRGYCDDDDCPLHGCKLSWEVIKLEHVFVAHVVALDVSKERVEIVFYLVVAHHVFYGFVVIEMMLGWFFLLRPSFYGYAT
jgi:hypothetical protein